MPCLKLHFINRGYAVLIKRERVWEMFHLQIIIMYEHIQHFLTLTIEIVVIFGYGGLILHYIATLLASKRMNFSEKLSAELAPDFVPLLSQ